MFEIKSEDDFYGGQATKPYFDWAGKGSAAYKTYADWTCFEKVNRKTIVIKRS